jgi:hypothetical protein
MAGPIVRAQLIVQRKGLKVGECFLATSRLIG